MEAAIENRNLDDVRKYSAELDRIRHRCILRISLQGFGEDYPAKTIKECPAWFEVHVCTNIYIAHIIQCVHINRCGNL